MSEAWIALGYAGVYGVLALAAIGSIIGCATAGQAAIGAMLDVESGFGRFVGVSAMPSSQLIYGIVLTLAFPQPVTATAGGAFFVIGIMAGVALLFSAVLQGAACASAIQASKEKPEVFGLALAPAAIVEGLAVFVFVFALVLVNGVPR